MYAYIARQPIFNINKDVSGYELLYRDGKSGNTASFLDGDMATRSVLSDAITLFGLPTLTNKRPAYVNFTQNLIMTDFAYTVNPSQIIVELLEEMQISEALLEKIKDLKKSDYTIALDDYTGTPEYDPLLPLVNIVKVDFMLTDRKRQRELARKLKEVPVILLAEKVETMDDFNEALAMGYTLFQGYFFEKPRIFNKRLPSLASSSYGHIMNELQKNDVDLNTCARIVHSDASMTYMVMQRVQSLQYYRGNLIANIEQALVMMGIGELRRYIILLLARQNNMTQSEELVRRAYLRGIFIEHLMAHIPSEENTESGFLLGMFSLLDRILNMQMEDILRDIPLDKDMQIALTGKRENKYSNILQYVIIYEMGNPHLLLPNIYVQLDEREVAELYMQCIVETDKTFNGFGRAV